MKTLRNMLRKNQGKVYSFMKVTLFLSVHNVLHLGTLFKCICENEKCWLSHYPDYCIMSNNDSSQNKLKAFS